MFINLRNNLKYEAEMIKSSIQKNFVKISVKCTELV